jgi:hypothetical protein
MTYDNIQFDINSSLLKMCTDFTTDNSLTDYETIDFDAHASINDLPNNDLIGIAEYSLMELEDMFEGSCTVMICTTQDDSYLEKLKPTVSKLFNRLRSGREIEVVNSSNGTVIGRLKIMVGTEATPVARTKSRPLQGINISFGLSLITVP